MAVLALNSGLQENIVFGSEFDEERYKKVIVQCGLERDLSLFEAGDATEVGEKGLTLSGGQKARITLARAVYSKAEIILLDDVLAALEYVARFRIRQPPDFSCSQCTYVEVDCRQVLERGPGQGKDNHLGGMYEKPTHLSNVPDQSS